MEKTKFMLDQFMTNVVFYKNSSFVGLSAPRVCTESLPIRNFFEKSLPLHFRSTCYNKYTGGGPAFKESGKEERIWACCLIIRHPGPFAPVMLLIQWNPGVNCFWRLARSLEKWQATWHRGVRHNERRMNCYAA